MKTKILSILALLLTVTQGAWADVTISSASDWNTFAANVTGGNTYSGQTVKLAANISVTTMVGTNTHPFAGTFDGQEHTLTVDYTASSEYCAPFAMLSGTVKNLKVAGSITTSGHRPASIAGYVSGGIITNCISSVDIKATTTGFIDGGGLVGRVNDGGLTMTGCAFTGSIDFSGSTGGGLVGFVSNSVTLTDCVFAPSAVTLSLSSPSFMMFSRGDGGTGGTHNITNCFYNDVAAAQTKITAQSGGKQTPISIVNAGNWNDLCTVVNSGYNYSGKTVELTANISVTTMVGTNTRPFAGTFDGQGNTLTVDYTASSESEYCAPFAVLSGTVKNLKVAGSITTSGHRPASIAGYVSGGTITNCISSVNIKATNTGWIDGGGLVARVNDEGLDMTGCAFTGSIDFSGSYGGGLVGMVSNSVTLTNCVFAPSAVTLNLPSPSFMMFSHGDGGTGGTHNITNCFYNDVAAAQTKITAQSGGKQMHSISAGTDVTSLAISGASTEYNVSGITVYSTGIKYNDVYYAGNGESVSLALSHGDKAGYTFYQYAVAGGGTLTAQTETSATLSMTDANQTINATWTENTATLTDGNDLSALLPYAGKTCTVTYTRSFTAGKASTVCLPFAYTKKTGDGSFYAFSGIEKVDNEYIATMTEPGTSTLTANTPYLYKAATTGVTDFSGTYAIPSIEAGSTTTTSGDWTFKGTYSTIEWTSAPAEHIYGFSAQDANDGIQQGQFVKVGSYVRIKPMRAYLQYSGSDSQFANARALMTRAAATTSDDTLPETIGVRLISANGEVTAIGTLYTRTGEVSFDSEAWYTLDGKRLNAKPNTKGIYVNNGKKVVIK